MTDKVELIRGKLKHVIERRLNLLNGDYFDLNEEVDGFTNEIMDIIDSLQEESASDDLDEEIRQQHRCFREIDMLVFEDIARHFAEWQKQQMIKDAISCKLCWYDGFYLDYTEEELCNAVGKRPLEVGDVLKVIIIKED